MSIIFDKIRKGLSVRTISVNSLSDLPSPSGNVITLLSNRNYIFTRDIDLQGLRVVAPASVAIKGENYYTTTISSTGLPSGQSVITASGDNFIESINISVPSNCIGMSANGSAIRGLIFNRVNFNGAGDAGVFSNITNLFFQNVGVSTSAKGITLNGTFSTVAMDDSLVSVSGASNFGITLGSTFNCSRRVRITYSAFISVSSATSIFVDPSAVVPIEGLIVESVNFAGGATYISGIAAQDNRLLVINSRGVAGSFSAAEYYMTSNTTATNIATQGTYTKVLGSTLSGSTVSKFSISNNRATFNGAISTLFLVNCRMSFSGSNNQIASFRIAKNGVTIPSSTSSRATTGASTIVSISTNALAQLSSGDFIEVFVTNTTGAQSITVSDLGVTITGK